jgi:phosphoglycerate kinase
VSTKLTILQALARSVDLSDRGGGIANTFMPGGLGLKIGKNRSPSRTCWPGKARDPGMKARGASTGSRPDVVVGPKTFAADARQPSKAARPVADDDLILDIGPATRCSLAGTSEAAGPRSSGTARWACSSSTPSPAAPETIARAIAGSSAFSIAGGGDTLAAIAKYGIEQDVGYISTGGGAFLEVLEGKKLPRLRDPWRSARRADGASGASISREVRARARRGAAHGSQQARHGPAGFAAADFAAAASRLPGAAVSPPPRATGRLHAPPSARRRLHGGT